MKTFDDIIFEKRNKAYGSYDLRKKYGRRVTSSLVLSLTLLVILFAYPVITSLSGRKAVKIMTNTVVVTAIKFAPDKVSPPPVLPSAPSSHAAHISKFTVPVVVPDEPESTTVINITEPLNPGDNTAPVMPPDPDSGLGPAAAPPVIEQHNPGEILTWVPEFPSFPGYVEFIAKHLRYPQEAREIGIQGTVYLSFVVEPDGSISNIKVQRGIGGGCDEEAIRVIKLMPNWSPGKQNGNPVRVILTLQVKFTLN